jgi:hypothetical protein
MPALWVGWQWDDYAHQLALHQFPETRQLTPSPLFMFTFAGGDVARNHELMRAGWLPWWSLENLRLAFFRPLTVLTHWLDHLLWPDSPALMHVHSLIWLGLLIAVSVILYRRLMGTTWVAGMAALLFALDDAHGVPAGWIANRNALIASVFVMLMLISHDSWRKNAWKPGVVIGPILFLFGLLAGEMALAGAGYLLAYAIFLDPDIGTRRFASLVPYAVAGGFWLIFYRALGFGAMGSAWYVDPVRDPIAFFQAFAERAPILLMGQWGFISSDIYMMLSIPAIRAFWVICVLFLIVLCRGILPVIRSSPMVRFWALGMALSLPLVCTTFPFDRLMVLSGLGAMGILAIFLKDALACNRLTRSMVSDPESNRINKTSALQSFQGRLALVLVVIHLILSPLSLPFRAWSPALLGKMVHKAAGVFPADTPLNDQELVIVNGPCAPIGGFFLSAIRRLNGDSVPKRIRMLSSTIYSVEVTRSDLNTLILRPKGGFLNHVDAVHSETDRKPAFMHLDYMFQQMDRTFRDDRYPFITDQEIDLNGLTVKITALTPDGRPAEAVFRFSVPLEDASLRWLQWHHDTLIPFSPPPVTETLYLSAPVLSYW